MKIRNGELKLFLDFLLSLPLKGKESRMRMRFIKFASTKLKDIEDERMQLIKEHAELNEDGEPKTDPLQDNKSYKLRDSVGFNKAFKELQLEEFVFDNTEERKDMLLTIKNAVLETEVEFSGDQAIYYDRWCDVVETITYE